MTDEKTEPPEEKGPSFDEFKRAVAQAQADHEESGRNAARAFTNIMAGLFVSRVAICVLYGLMQGWLSAVILFVVLHLAQKLVGDFFFFANTASQDD